MRDDIAAFDNIAPVDGTISTYLEEFRRNYFIEELSGWDAPIRSKSRLRTKPKRYFCDPALVASFIGCRLFATSQRRTAFWFID